MKFHFFHLMPYPDLPDDFRQRYHGVWVDLPAAELFDPHIGFQAYNDYLDELEFAEGDIVKVDIVDDRLQFERLAQAPAAVAPVAEEVPLAA